MTRPRIVLADDHTMVVEVIRKLLENEFEIVGTAPDGETLLHIAQELKPDVVIIDIGLPGMSGMEAGRELKHLLPTTRSIALTVSEDPDLAATALRHWASGYLLKNSAASELVKAIREALKGRNYVTPKIAHKLPGQFVRNPTSESRKELTTRQREVLRALAEGWTMKEAAAFLHVTPRTIAFHKYRIMEEFALKTNSDLVKFAIREGVISPQ